MTDDQPKPFNIKKKLKKLEDDISTVLFCVIFIGVVSTFANLLIALTLHK